MITSFNFAFKDIGFTFDYFSSELLSHKAFLDTQCMIVMFNTPFAFVANKKFSYQYKKSSAPTTCPSNSQKSHSSEQTTICQNSIRSRPTCQIYDKTRYIVIDCYHRLDFLYQGHRPSFELATIVAESNAQYEHQVWYTDNGANIHITSNDQNLY